MGHSGIIGEWDMRQFQKKTQSGGPQGPQGHQGQTEVSVAPSQVVSHIAYIVKHVDNLL